MQYFEELASIVRSRWSSIDRDPEELTEVAVSAFRDCPPPAELGFAQLTSWALEAENLPKQVDMHGLFGQPPITVVHEGGFYIDAYVWFEASTAIHQHGFSGAFLVLDGSSLHTVYEFEPRAGARAQLQLGDLSLKALEVLRPGECRPIVAGSRLIHSVYHLESPSVSLVIRGGSDDTRHRRLQYDPPTVTYDPFAVSESVRKRLQVMRAALRSGAPSGVASTRAWLARAPLLEAYLILQGVVECLNSIRTASPYFTTARERHGGQVDELQACIAESMRRRSIASLRRRVVDPGHRFLLALVMNLSHRTAIEDAVRRTYPSEDPLSKICCWLDELAQLDLATTREDPIGAAPLLDGTSTLVAKRMLLGLDELQLVSAVSADCNALGIRTDPAAISMARAVVPYNPIVRPLFR